MILEGICTEITRKTEYLQRERGQFEKEQQTKLKLADSSAAQDIQELQLALRTLHHLLHVALPVRVEVLV